jgi:hypothetical protein
MSAASGLRPFTIGIGFRKGDATDVQIELPYQQVDIKRRWGDGSIKHAIISGRASLTAAMPLTVHVVKGTPGAISALTAASIAAAAPLAIVQCGTDAASLSRLLANPLRTWISGPELVECHYRTDAGALSVWFHVRLYADGRMRVRAIVENGFLDNGSGAKASSIPLTYDAAITIGGVTVYSGAITHYAHTAWQAEGWIGGDPGVTAVHDVAYLQSTKLVPNYALDGLPSDATLDALPNAYVPMGKGEWTAKMGGTGFQSQIGLLPNWDALYCKSGDARALKAVEVNSHALKSFPIVWRDSVTKLTIKPSTFPTWTASGPKQGGVGQLVAGPLAWELNHHGSGGYLAYLLTGDYAHYDNLSLQSAASYLCITSTRGSGVDRKLINAPRGVAWMCRTLAQYAAIAPEGDDVAADYRMLLANQFAYWAEQGPENAAASRIGYPAAMSTYNETKPLTAAPWMYHFWIAVNGYAWDIEPGFGDPAKHVALRDFMYRAVVGILGEGGADSYCYTKASAYTIRISDVVRPNYSDSTPDIFYRSWGKIFAATFGDSNAACGPLLEGQSAGQPAGATGGYWGNLLPAIAYAVDHGAKGASDAWVRLTGATNWSDIASADFGNVPVWGIAPRPIVPPVVAAAPPIVSPSRNVPAWVSALPLWQWYEIPNTSISSVDPVPRPKGQSGPSSKIIAWNGAALKRKGSVYIIGAAGGHADYGGNEVDALALNVDSPKWVQLRGPSPNEKMIDASPFYLDLKGAACHTYWTSQFIESRGRLVIFRGSGVSGGPFPHPPANWPYLEHNWHKAFNLATNDWDAPDYIARIPASGAGGAAAMCCQNPLNGDVYFSIGGTVNPGWYVWTNSANSWERRSGTNLSFAGSAVDPSRGRILTVGGYRNVPPSIRDFDGRKQDVTFGGLGAGAITDPINTYPGVVYDEANDCFLVLRNSGRVISTYRVDARTLEVTALAIAGTPPAARTNGVHNSVQYAPELRGIVIANRHDGNVYFLRTAM